MPLPLKELLQFERWLEDGFKEILASVSPNTYTSRDPQTESSPRITILATVNEPASAHVHPTSNGNSIYDAFVGEVEIEVATNRTTETKSNAHYELIGGVRAAMIDYLARNSWNENNPIRLNDVRPQSAPHSVDADKNLDFTALTFYIVFNVNPTQWPDNL